MILRTKVVPVCRVQRLCDAMHELWEEQTKASGYQWHSWIDERAANGDPCAKAWVKAFEALNDLEGGGK